MKARSSPSATLTEDDALALLRVGTVLGRGGNRELQRLLLTSLAAAHPNLGSDLVEHGGRSLSELAAQHTFSTPNVSTHRPRRAPRSSPPIAIC